MSFNALSMNKFGIGFGPLAINSIGLLVGDFVLPPEPPVETPTILGGTTYVGKKKPRKKTNNLVNYNNQIITFVISIVVSGVLDE